MSPPGIVESDWLELCCKTERIAIDWHVRTKAPTVVFLCGTCCNACQYCYQLGIEFWYSSSDQMISTTLDSSGSV